jgi:preprotein translocase subunit SecA
MHETRHDPAFAEAEPAPGPIGGDGATEAAVPVRSRQGAASLDPRNPATWGRVARNAPCPCGSGKKYKHCHGRLA